jgi:hypothetical protein
VEIGVIISTFLVLSSKNENTPALVQRGVVSHRVCDFRGLSLFGVPQNRSGASRRYSP